MITYDREKINDAYRTVFQTTAGEIIYHDLLCVCDPDDLVGDDSHDTYRMIGRREVLKHIVNRIGDAQADE